MKLNLANVLRLAMALTILASGLLRPPGMMLVAQGETLTYVLCTGGAEVSVEIPVDGTPPADRDLGCDFFAAQVASLMGGAPQAAPVETRLTRSSPVLYRDRGASHAPWSANKARAPPLVS